MDILIVDDHPLFSCGLIELLSSADDSLNVQSCTSYEQARTLLSNEEARLILLDLDLGYESGVELSKLITAYYPESKVAILSANENIDVMKQCFLNGVVGYIKKSSDPNTVIHAVNLLLADGTYFPSNLLPYLLSPSAEQATPSISTVDASEFRLTSRQFEVLSFLRKGYSNKLIAYEMGIAEGTVKLHVSTLLNKLGVSNRSEAIIKTN